MTYVVVSSGHLRGLHGLGAPATQSDQAKQALLAKAKRDFVAACDELLAGTITACNRIKANATFFGGSRTKEVCALVEGNVESGITALKKTDAAGVPLFVRKPEKAQELLALIQTNASTEIEEHKQLMIETGHASLFGEFGFDSLKQFIKQVVDKLFEILQFLILTLLEGAVKAPVVGIAVAAAVAAFVWYKFLR